MRRHTTRSTLAIAATFVAVAAVLGGCGAVAPSSAGPRETSRIAIGPFERLRVANGIAIEVRNGPTDAITVNAPAATLAHVVTNVTAGELSIGLDASGLDGGHVTATVSTPSLESIIAGTGSSATVIDLRAEALTLTASEGARIAIGGRAGELDVTATMSASIEALDLAVGDTTVDLGTSAQATIRSSTRIEGTVHESAVLRVAGSPSMAVETRTSGRIEPLGLESSGGERGRQDSGNSLASKA